MDSTEEPWELFDLEADLQVTLSEDGKEYLRQFGLEQYDFENYQPDDDPGKYFQDVPLEQNPEALFDLLTRESFKDSSNRRPSATAPPRRGPTLSSARESAGTKQRHDVTSHGQRSRKAGVSPTYHSIDVDLDQGAASASPKTLPKRVSFTETGLPPASTRQADKENTPGDSRDASRQQNSRSVTTFFGRPKVKQNKKSAEQATNEDTKYGGMRISGTGRHDNNIAGSAVQLQEAKKPWKFKFPGLDLKGRTKKSAGNNNKHAGKTSPEENCHLPVRGGVNADVAGAGSASGGHSSSLNGRVGAPQRRGVERVDLLQGSPELGAGAGSPTGGAAGGASSVTDSDSETYMTTSRSHVSSSPATKEDLQALDLPAVAAKLVDDAAAGAASPDPARRVQKDVRVVEIVSSRISETPNTTTHGRNSGDAITGGRSEHLPPVLLAAVTGDINLLKESVAHLSHDSLNKLRDAVGNTILHASVAGGHLHCTRFICRHCPQLATSENKAHITPTAMAIKHGQIEVLDWLLDNMNLRQELCPSHTRRRSLLHHAAKFGQDGCLRLLLSKIEAGGQLEEMTDQFGNTPAHIAAKYGHLMCIQSLVEYGMDVCSVNQYGHTPCYYADFNNHRHCAGYLMVVDTCAMLAQNQVTQASHMEWLLARNDTVSAFTTEVLGLSGAIARQSSDDVDITYRLQQTLDDAMDLVGDMASQLNHLYELTCHLQDEAGKANSDELRLPSPGKDDLRVSMERATELQRRLEELDQSVNHQTSRQQLLKVKEVQRRWETVMSEPRREPPNPDQEARQLNRKLFSDAVQRLLVYRTNDRTARQMAPLITVADQMILPQASSVSRQMTALTSPSHGEEAYQPDALRKLSPRARVEVPPLNTQSNSANHDHPRAHAEAAVSSTGSGFRTSGLSFTEPRDPSRFKHPGSANNLTSLDIESSGTSESSKEELVTRTEVSDRRRSQQKQVKNNVVESFLKSRVFYQQEPLSATTQVEKGSTAGLFYSDDQLPPISQLKTPDSLGLKFSEFSAFNRVTNRPMVDNAHSVELFGMVEGSLQSSDHSVSSSVSQGLIKRGKEEADKSHEGANKSSDNQRYDNKNYLSNRKPTGEEKSIKGDMGFIPNNEMTSKKGLVHRLVSHIEDTDASNHCVPGTKGPRIIAPGIYLDSEGSEEAISEPTIPPPPQPPTQPPPPPPPQCKQQPLQKPQIPAKPPKPAIASKPRDLCLTSSQRDHTTARDVSVTSSARDQSMTSSSDSATSVDREEDEEDSEDLSGVDLGEELDGDDLMLAGPRTFLDDELDGDGDEQFVDDMFSPEELLALAPRGTLPLSMQFETSLSTIEEVSVVSESTRADDNHTDIEAREESSQSDDTVTQPSDAEGDKDRGSLGNLGLKGQIASSSPIVPPLAYADGDKPWYETSDDDDGSPALARLTRQQVNPDHFTLF